MLEKAVSVLSIEFTTCHEWFRWSINYCALPNVRVRGIAPSAAEKAAEDFRELLEIFSRVNLQCVRNLHILEWMSHRTSKIHIIPSSKPLKVG